LEDAASPEGAKENAASRVGHNYSGHNRTYAFGHQASAFCRQYNGSGKAAAPELRADVGVWASIYEPNRIL
jgi:hypothetical protein